MEFLQSRTFLGCRSINFFIFFLRDSDQSAFQNLFQPIDRATTVTSLRSKYAKYVIFWVVGCVKSSNFINLLQKYDFSKIFQSIDRTTTVASSWPKHAKYVIYLVIVQVKSTNFLTVKSLIFFQKKSGLFITMSRK